MLTKVKVCGKYQHQDGSRALINGKKPITKKMIFQKNKSKFVEDLENDNDNLEDDTDNKKEDIEEYMDKYSLEYDVNAGVVDANGASDDIAIQDNNNNLKNNNDDDINYDFNTEIPTTKSGISNSEFPTESPIEIATTKFSDDIPNSDEQDDLLNNIDLTTELFSGDYQTDSPSEIATTKFSDNIPNSNENNDLLNNNDLTTELFSGDYQTEGSLSNSEFQTNGPTITTIFQQKHERQPKRNVVSILCKIGFFLRGQTQNSFKSTFIW